jgi:hypothetical protein
MLQYSFDEIRAKRWAAIRSAGKTRWILIRGIFYFGGLLFVFGITFHALRHGSDSLWDIGDFVGRLIGAIIGGLLYGFMTWNSSEKAYDKYEKK